MNNWKTTLAAVIGGVVVLLNKYLIPAIGVEPLPSDVLIVIVLGVVSLFMKDHDTTGAGINAEKK